MYLAKVFLQHCKNASQVETQVRSSRLHVFTPKNCKNSSTRIFAIEGMDERPARTFASTVVGSPSGSDCPSRPSIIVIDLKICMAQKLAAELAELRRAARCTATKHKSSTYACPEGILTSASSLQYFAGRKGSARKSGQWKSR